MKLGVFCPPQKTLFSFPHHASFAFKDTGAERNSAELDLYFDAGNFDPESYSSELCLREIVFSLCTSFHSESTSEPDAHS